MLTSGLLTAGRWTKFTGKHSAHDRTTALSSGRIATRYVNCNWLVRRYRMTLSRCIKPASVLMLALATPLFSQSGFYGQDRNGDGVITRDEWRGSDQSFRQRDVNEDGVLSGNELPARMRTRRQTQARNDDQNRYNER